ncbi:hypothetical protein TNIN_68021 [Trichonephila inaurata madagascariensis]|uniref:Uncharacterized protein n=1 Tax=Trichonephila inaurata madagascariensis TaxID=2747483 RepID=A0A8X7BVB4_9ARAC|nr:hypothetical protein TNIN_68021 [Trichonephila inaurata madagascariensis]
MTIGSILIERLSYWRIWHSPTNPSEPAASELPAKSFLKQCVISGRQGQPRNDHQDSNLAKSGDNVINLPMGVHRA